MLRTLAGDAVLPLGLAHRPEQAQECVASALARGINLFFSYGPAHLDFVRRLQPGLTAGRDAIFVASGSEDRLPRAVRRDLDQIRSVARCDVIDAFFALYLHPGDDEAVVDVLAELREEGAIRHVGVTTHNRPIAARMSRDERVDVVMHRFNMAHRRAATEVFVGARAPIVAFTATRWSTLLAGHPAWPTDPPTAPDCYRYCLSEPAVEVVLTAPQSLDELRENLAVLDENTMTEAERSRWERYGDLVYGDGRGSFETTWP